MLKKLFKTMRKKKNHNKIVVLARSRLNTIENVISQALIDNEINYEEFTIITNEVKYYRKLKKRFKMMKSQRRDVERDKLTEDGKKNETR